MKATVASVMQTNSTGFCKALEVTVKGYVFLLDFFVLELNDCDAVIGTEVQIDYEVL